MNDNTYVKNFVDFIIFCFSLLVSLFVFYWFNLKSKFDSVFNQYEQFFLDAATENSWLNPIKLFLNSVDISTLGWTIAYILISTSCIYFYFVQHDSEDDPIKRWSHKVIPVKEYASLKEETIENLKRFGLTAIPYLMILSIALYSFVMLVLTDWTPVLGK